MKTVRRSAFVISLFCSAFGSLAQQEHCGAAQDRLFFWKNEPLQLERWQQQQQAINNWLATNYDPSPRSGIIITIPLVVHLLWNQPEENLSNEVILSQLDVLNRDFRSLNQEIPGIPPIFQPLIADVEIEFCLANADPNGLPTTGITRTFTNNSIGIGGTVAIHYTNQGGHDAWDPTRYLNIWVAKFAGSLAGTSSFPGQGPPEQDGVEINYRYFGTIGAEPPYHFGRTLTHEIGHYLNLEHPWGPSILDCCGDDFVADTPLSCETYIGTCPVHPVISCLLPDMFMNYLFYTADSCMGMFTLGQKARMLATLSLSRNGLASSGACALSTQQPLSENFQLWPNPCTDILHFRAESTVGDEISVKICDLLGRSILNTRLPMGGKGGIPTDELQPGIYFLRANTGQREYLAHFYKH